jgi:predicted NAD/FAD-dependent oxidoreductase
VRTKDGVIVEASTVILAVPSAAVARLIPPSARAGLHLGAISSAAPSPILCIHLWYDRRVAPHPVVGVVGRRVQWVFRHARGGGEAEASGGSTGRATIGADAGERLALVISAAYEEAAWTNEALIASGVEDCVGVFGELARAPSHAVVIREKRATFSLSPSVEAMRPGARTPLANLFLSGDWTDTGLPATVEGAIRSGEAAAELAARVLNA